MVAEIARNRTDRLVGHAYPRVAPPIPARSDLRAYQDTAKTLGISLMPWQEVAARYLEARGPGKRHLYREVAIVVSRQNGKTTLLIPLIVKRLLAGQRIMHTAQDRSFPREVFYRVAEQMWEKHSRPVPDAQRPTYQAPLRQRSALRPSTSAAGSKQ
jgi:phage terminase large subunit-like protein